MQIHTNHPPSTQTNSQKPINIILFSAAILLCISTGVFAYFYYQEKSTNDSLRNEVADLSNQLSSSDICDNNDHLWSDSDRTFIEHITRALPSEGRIGGDFVNLFSTASSVTLAIDGQSIEFDAVGYAAMVSYNRTHTDADGFDEFRSLLIRTLDTLFAPLGFNRNIGAFSDLNNPLSSLKYYNADRHELVMITFGFSTMSWEEALLHGHVELGIRYFKL